MGSEKGIEMKCWTREEYLKFSEYMMDDPVGYYYFQMLYVTNDISSTAAGKSVYGFRKLDGAFVPDEDFFITKIY